MTTKSPFPLNIDINKIPRQFSVVINIFKNGATVLTPDNEILNFTVSKSSIKGGDNKNESQYDKFPYDYKKDNAGPLNMDSFGLNIPDIKNGKVNNADLTAVNKFVKTKLDDKVYIVCYYENNNKTNQNIYYIYGIEFERTPESERSLENEIDYYTELEHKSKIKIELLKDKILNINCIIDKKVIKYLTNSKDDFVDISNSTSPNNIKKFNYTRVIDEFKNMSKDGILKLIMTVKKDPDVASTTFYDNLYKRIEMNNSLKKDIDYNFSYKLVNISDFKTQIKNIITTANNNNIGKDNGFIFVKLTHNDDQENIIVENIILIFFIIEKSIYQIVNLDYQRLSVTSYLLKNLLDTSYLLKDLSDTIYLLKDLSLKILDDSIVNSSIDQNTKLSLMNVDKLVNRITNLNY